MPPIHQNRPVLRRWIPTLLVFAGLANQLPAQQQNPTFLPRDRPTRIDPAHSIQQSSGDAAGRLRPEHNSLSNEQLVEMRRGVNAGLDAQVQRMKDASRAVDEAIASNRPQAERDAVLRRFLQEGQRVSELRASQRALDQSMRARQITPDGKWNLPHPTRNPPPGDVASARLDRMNQPGTPTQPQSSASQSSGGAAPQNRPAQGDPSRAIAGADQGRWRSDTVAERAPAAGNSVPRDPTINTGTKPTGRGDATMDLRGAAAAGLEAATGNNVLNRHTITDATKAAQKGVRPAMPLIVGADLAAQAINRSQDIAEGKAVPGVGSVVRDTSIGRRAGAALATAATAAGGVAGAAIGGTIGFILSGGNPAVATAGGITGAQLGAQATTGALTAIAAIRAGDNLATALDRASFNAANGVTNSEDVLRDGLGPASANTTQGPLAGPVTTDLAAPAGNPAVSSFDQMRSQLIQQFPELANASPAEQDAILNSILQVSDSDRRQSGLPTDAQLATPVAQVTEPTVPVDPPEVRTPPEGNGSGEPDDAAAAAQSERDALHAQLDRIEGPREGFSGSALEDFLDQLDAGSATTKPAQAGDSSDFADPTLSTYGSLPAVVVTIASIDLSGFTRGQQRDDLRSLFRTDGDYQEAMRLEGDLRRLEDEYRRRVEDARRLQAERRNAEAERARRLAEIAHQQWLNEQKRIQQWMAQQQAYARWRASQNTSHAAPTHRAPASGHHGRIFFDSPQ